MTAEKHELNDQELNQSVGGRLFDDSKRTIFDNKGREIGKRAGKNGRIVYYPCEKCRKPMHGGSAGWYCDPCNDHLMIATGATWTGTVEELQAAANS